MLEYDSDLSLQASSVDGNEQRNFEQQLNDHTEEDIALLGEPTLCFSDEDDIDDGEYWGDLEDFDINNDIECSLYPISSEDHQRPNIPSNEEEEEHFHKASSITTFLSVMIAKFSYRYNITANALSALLKLFALFLSVISTLSYSVSAICSLIPSSLYNLKSFLHINENNFIKYVVCPSCHALYHLEDCFELRAGKKIPKMCSHIAYPAHPHYQRRLPCGERLVSEVVLKSGNSKYYPRKYYCYKPICESLALLCERKGFLPACEVWRLRETPAGMLCDIYDGQVWKDFQFVNGVPFLAAPHNLALMLNIDWFRPYKHTPYSVGAIYIVITNLSRSMRFKKENLILVGIVPGPGEPPIHMNTYLDPLVEELKVLWEDGIQVTSPEFPHPVTLRAALICSACDIPACRKVLGFYGHMSKMGCSKCTKEFNYDSTSDRILFSGFGACPLRTEDEHRQQAFEAMGKNTQSARDKMEKKYGSRYSAFMKLPYFDCVRFHVVDPMHNLFLGTAKYVMKKVWLNEEYPLIPKTLHQHIQERVDKCLTPSSIGRIPHKIASAFSSFTADQWKSWTNIFSLYALHGILDDDDYGCWHRLLLEFCAKFESLYGSHKSHQTCTCMPI